MIGFPSGCFSVDGKGLNTLDEYMASRLKDFSFSPGLRSVAKLELTMVENKYGDELVGRNAILDC